MAWRLWGFGGIVIWCGDYVLKISALPFYFLFLWPVKPFLLVNFRVRYYIDFITSGEIVGLIFSILGYIQLFLRSNSFVKWLGESKLVLVSVLLEEPNSGGEVIKGGQFLSCEVFVIPQTCWKMFCEVSRSLDGQIFYFPVVLLLSSFVIVCLLIIGFFCQLY
ncbi:MAG: hypothetical protein EZS28_015987 [Streblomastix strix]|uniref:Uncharacterized protein n=1 Tax=Streblomastix strix TaxID=222440 RepID=A0A5J4W0S9_9EUKA|nr:MAG: hypothetical protein EZS28_015987 [Streblomastix strix]